MDRPQPVTCELERDLANIRSLNRWFGSYRQVRHFLVRWLKPNDKARILDVSTGSGDIPRLIADFARERNISVQIYAIDQQGSTIESPRGRSNDYPQLEYFSAHLFASHPP